MWKYSDNSPSKINDTTIIKLRPWKICRNSLTLNLKVKKKIQLAPLMTATSWIKALTKQVFLFTVDFSPDIRECNLSTLNGVNQKTVSQVQMELNKQHLYVMSNKQKKCIPEDDQMILDWNLRYLITYMTIKYERSSKI